MRTGNPPCHVCIIHNERGTLSPSHLSQFSATRRNFPLIVSVQCYLMRQGVFLLPVMSVTQFDMTRGKNPLRCIRSILFDTTERENLSCYVYVTQLNTVREETFPVMFVQCYLTQQGGGSLSIMFMQLSSMRWGGETLTIVSNWCYSIWWGGNPPCCICNSIQHNKDFPCHVPPCHCCLQSWKWAFMESVDTQSTWDGWM